MEEKFNQIKYQNKYNKENYERINLNFKIGEKEIFKAQARKRGYKDKEFSKYVRDLIYQDMRGEWRISKKLFIIYLQPSISKCVTVKGDRHAPRNTILPPT